MSACLGSVRRYTSAQMLVPYASPPANHVLGPVKVSGTDAVHGGTYRITGTVKVTPATPAYRKVTLFDSTSRLLIRETWSDAVTGSYAFNNIRAGTFFVVSVDHTGLFNAVIADRLVAEPMP